MNDDGAEVNSLDPPMLPGSFLHEKAPTYEASLILCCKGSVKPCTLTENSR